MPRDGQGIYGPPLGTKAVPKTVISSDRFNAYVDDQTALANEPRPITAGGTGASTLEGARNSLKLLLRTGDRMEGALSSAVKDHGTLGTVTEEFKYGDGNTHRFTCNGTVTINPTGLAEGDVLQVNMLYQAGSVAVSGTTQWELGGTQKGASITDVGATLVAGAVYCLVFEMRAGKRTGIFQ